MISDTHSLLIGGSVEKLGVVVKGKATSLTTSNAYLNSIVIIFLPETSCSPVKTKIA